MFELFKPDPSGYVLGKDKWFWFILVGMLCIGFLQVLIICDIGSGFRDGFNDIQDTLGMTRGQCEGVYNYWETKQFFFERGYELGIGIGAIDYYKQIKKECLK